MSIKYSGVKVFVGSEQLVVPALSVAQVKQHRAFLSGLKGWGTTDPTDTELDAAVSCIGDAVRRNYPERTDEQLSSELDMRSIGECVSAIVAQTKLEVVRPGEA